MPLEGNITDLSSLNPAWPLDSDNHDITDDNLRKCKDAAKKGFSSMGSAGGVATITAAEFNNMQGVTSNVQQQLTAKLPSWTLVTGPLKDYTASPGENLLFEASDTGFWIIRLPASPQNGTQLRLKDIHVTLVPGTDYTLQVVRSGIDTITDLDNQTAGASAITPSLSIAQRTFYFVHFDNTWFTWTLLGS